MTKQSSKQLGGGGGRGGADAEQGGGEAEGGSGPDSAAGPARTRQKGAADAADAAYLARRNKQVASTTLYHTDRHTLTAEQVGAPSLAPVTR
jgi:hypothetical protein